jgi:hypothetical protein
MREVSIASSFGSSGPWCARAWACGETLCPQPREPRPTGSVRPRRQCRGSEQSDINAQAADDRASELARAFAQVATLSVRAAAEELTRRGVPTPSGGQWHPTQVARVRARLAS